MKIRMLAGVACAALMGLAAPANAATVPSFDVTAGQSSADSAVNAFYAARHGSPLWLRNGAATPAAQTLIEALTRAKLDGMASGPALAAEARALLARAASDPSARANADRLLSTAWVLYVQALETPPSGVSYGDNWVAPRRSSPAQILADAAQAGSLAAHVRKVAEVNPLYAQLREAAWARAQADGGGELDPRVLASLDRVRTKPVQDRYVMVDAAGARLYMIDDNRIVDSMKVIVGASATQTPMMASTIHYATLNPYWNVPGDFIQSTMVGRIKDQGLGYLKAHNYEVLSAETGEVINPASVDWDAVGAGTKHVRMRQLPGPANSMGRMKFAFPNSNDIYLHDTPKKELFAQADRDLSHGCVRLEDAARLGRWLLGRAPVAASSAPEQHVLLPKPVPIYVTYMTAQATGGQLSFVEDVYGHDAQASSQVASLR